MKKNFGEEIKKALEFIKNNSTEEDPWVIITVRDIKNKFGLSMYHANKFFDLLEHQIVIHHAIAEERKVSNKPKKFKIIDPDKKIDYIAEEEQYKGLTQDDVYEISKKTGHTTQTQEEYETLLLLCELINYFTIFYSRMVKFKLDLEMISEDLTITKKHIESGVVELVKSKILIVIDDPELGISYKIVLPIIQVDRKIRNFSKISPEKLEQYRKKDSSKEEEDYRQAQKAIEKQISTAPTKDEYQKILYEFENLKSHVNNFQEFIDHKTEAMGEKINQSKVGYETVNRLIASNEELLNERADLRQKEEQLKEEISTLEELFVEKQEKTQLSLQELLGVITEEVHKFAELADWEKNKENAKKLEEKIVKTTVGIIKRLH